MKTPSPRTLLYTYDYVSPTVLRGGHFLMIEVPLYRSRVIRCGITVLGCNAFTGAQPGCRTARTPCRTSRIDAASPPNGSACAQPGCRTARTPCRTSRRHAASGGWTLCSTSRSRKGRAHFVQIPSPLWFPFRLPHALPGALIFTIFRIPPTPSLLPPPPPTPPRTRTAHQGCRHSRPRTLL
jgi:hypothetical protein